MQTVCQDLLEALEHFEAMLDKVERDLGWRVTKSNLHSSTKQVNFLLTFLPVPASFKRNIGLPIIKVKS